MKHSSFNNICMHHPQRVKDTNYLHVCPTVVEGDTARAWNTTTYYRYFSLNIVTYMQHIQI